VTPSGHYKHTRDRAHERVYVEKLKLTMAVKSGSERTHLVVVDSFP
jgi:hypothetical protein